MKKFTLTLTVTMLSIFSCFGQSSDFVGTFVNGSNSISIQFKRVGDEYHGLLERYGLVYFGER